MANFRSADTGEATMRIAAPANDAINLFSILIVRFYVKYYFLRKLSVRVGEYISQSEAMVQPGAKRLL